MSKIEDIKAKLNEFVEAKAKWANKNGSTQFDTCNYSGWDKDIWNNKNAIMDKLRSMGFQVTSKTNHGVLDVYIVKPIKL